jgi:hypothetical protein
MPSFRSRRGVCTAAGSLLVLGAVPASAQRSEPRPAAGDRWTVAGEYLHLGAAPIQRRAEPSMRVALGRALGAGHASRAVRVEAGWLRASRVTTQAQGVTLGVSAGLPVGGRATEAGDAGPVLALRPGLAVLAGWAEAQGESVWYSWRGLPGTSLEGQVGTASRYTPVRGRTTGAGVSLAADLRLTPALALTGSVQRWAFTGAVIRPNRQATLAGVGLAVRPRAFAGELHRLWNGSAVRPASAAPQGATRVARPTVPASESALVDGSRQ